MNRETRIQLIKEIGKDRGSRVLCYLTGDRRGFETRIAPDVFPLLYEHLSKVGKTKSIDLFLYSTGGITIAGWGLVNLIREFCDKFSVIIPFKAHSTATLIALGANEIIMCKPGQLSPVDPSITSPYNPVAPGIQQPGGVNLLPVSVEDVIAYLSLAKKEAELKDEPSIAEVFKILSEKVHPLALGSVFRAREQIKLLTEKLLGFHMPKAQEKKIGKIISTLTKELYSHDYLIGRKEAKNTIKLKVIDVKPELENKIWHLYKAYENMLELNISYNPDTFLGNEEQKIGRFNRAVIESEFITDVFITEREIKKVQVSQPGMPIPMTGVQERTISEGWVRESF
ncbi:MAG: serine protease [Nitrospirota bacterium]|jgi:hypothetical protein